MDPASLHSIRHPDHRLDDESPCSCSGSDDGQDDDASRSSTSSPEFGSGSRSGSSTGTGSTSDSSDIDSHSITSSSSSCSQSVSSVDQHVVYRRRRSGSNNNHRDEVQQLESEVREAVRQIGQMGSDPVETSTHVTGFTLMYLTPVTDPVSGPGSSAGNERDCITYCYPGTALQNDPLVVKLKGMFLTLSQVVNQITSQKPITTTIRVKQNHCMGYNEREVTATPTPPSTLDSDEDDSYTNYCVTYVHEYTSFLMIALSDQLNQTVASVKDIISAISKVMRIRFTSLDAAFKNPENHSVINRLISNMMSQIFDQNAHPLIPINPFLVPRLQLDDEDLILTINDSINEFESMEWLDRNSNNTLSSSGSYEVSPEDFVVVASSFYQNGFLIASHMSPDVLSDVTVYHMLTGLIKSSVTSIRLVDWIEVNCSREESENQHRVSTTSGQSINSGSNYCENPASRSFVILISLQGSLLISLIQIPFMSVADPSITRPNEPLIQLMFQFLQQNFIASGVCDQIMQHISMHKKCYTMRVNRLNELLSNQTTSSPFKVMLSFKQSKGKLRKRIKSLSLKGLALKQQLQNQNPEADLRMTPSPSKNSPVVSPIVEKSVSSPSLLPSSSLSSVHKRQSASNFERSSSLMESNRSLSCRTTTSTSASISDQSQFSASSSGYNNLSIKALYDETRKRMPDDLIFFIDQDSKSGTFVSPVIQCIKLPDPNDTEANACGRKNRNTFMTEEMIRLQVLPKFRESCLHLKRLIQQNYPLVCEYGIHVTIKLTDDINDSTPDPKDKTKQEFDPHHSPDKKDKRMLHLWCCVRKESDSREVYACFAMNQKSLNNCGLEVSLEIIGYGIQLQNRIV